jgi:tRNA1Val (adenine37-N6)-methyltransferase
MELDEFERLDRVNDALSLIQRTDGLTFGTDALLLAAYTGGKYKHGLELGSGSGIITLFLLSRSKLELATCLEVQDVYARLSAKNADLNGFKERMEVVCTDLRDFRRDGDFDLVYTNPPYMKSTSGRANLTDAKNIARHEVKGDICDFLKCASRALKWGGSFLAVYRPDRLTDLICAMRDNGIEPKRLTAVHADSGAVPSMVLVEGKRGGRSGMKMTAPLIIYCDKEHTSYGEDMNYIMETGSFPDKFKV